MGVWYFQRPRSKLSHVVLSFLWNRKTLLNIQQHYWNPPFPLVCSTQNKRKCDRWRCHVLFVLAPSGTPLPPFYKASFLWIDLDPWSVVCYTVFSYSVTSLLCLFSVFYIPEFKLFVYFVFLSSAFKKCTCAVIHMFIQLFSVLSFHDRFLEMEPFG